MFTVNMHGLFHRKTKVDKSNGHYSGLMKLWFLCSEQKFIQHIIKEKRHIGESGRLISDVVEIAKIKKLDGFLVAMDTEKVFDSLDYDYLILSQEKYDFRKNFILSVEILRKDQESFVINGGTTTKLFSLGSGAREGDPISAFLFTLSLEILFILIKTRD